MASFRGIPPSSFYSRMPTRVNILPIPDDHISEDSFDDEDSDYDPADNMELEDSDDEIPVPESESEVQETEESVENMQTDSDSIEEQSSKSKKKTKKTNEKKSEDKKKKFSWKKTSWKRPPSSNIPIEKMKPSDGSLSSLNQPFEFFKQFLTNELLDHITFQTNLYNTQRAALGYKPAVRKRGSDTSCYKKVKVVTKHEIQQVIGIILYMGIHKLPNRRMYWAPTTCVQLIASSMNRNRFEEILSILHFNNNQEAITDPANSNYDKLFKLKPLIDHFRTVFKGSVTAETMQCIDEMMVPFKGRHSAKQYMPKKPCKWGYKLWCRAGMSGYVYDFEILGSRESKGPPPGVNPEFGESENVVLRLSKDLEENRHQLFFDNFFSSPELLVYLMSKGIFAVATLRSDRSRDCPLPVEKDMKKNGRGDLAEFTDSKAGLVICAWYDNRRVLTISNFLGKDPISNCKRYDRKKKETVSLPRPASVELYNKYMGGVDKADMFLSLYRTKHRSRKWYHRIAFHLISLAAVNAFVLYCEIGGSGSFLDFIVDICRCLLAVEEPDDPNTQSTSIVSVERSLKASQVPNNVRLDKCNHWPVQAEKPQRCKNTSCSRRTRFLCSKCQVYLCVTGTTCFLDYHGITSCT